MQHREIVRSILLLATRSYPASSPLAKDIIEWARQSGAALFGLSKRDASRLSWAGLKRALGAGGPQIVAPSQTVALARRLAAVLGLEGADANVVSVIVALNRAEHACELAEIFINRQCNLPMLVGRLAGFSPSDAERCVRRNPLVRMGLVRFKADWRGKVELDLRWSLTSLLDRQPEDEQGIVEAMVGERHPDGLPIISFAHVEEVDFLVRLLVGAHRENASGINILLHGPPGTGKTELARRLAAEAGLALYGVAEGMVDGYEPDRSDRVGALELGHHLLKRRPAALIFDEMEDLIGNARLVEDRVSGREGSKVFVNRMLETNPVPVIWTTNAIGNVDAAILRRMSFVLHLDYPRTRAALDMLDRVARDEGVVPGAELKALVETSRETTSVLRAAMRSAWLAGEADGGLVPARSLVKSLNGGRIPHPAPGEVDLALYEADRPVAELFKHLRQGKHSDVSILLGGPPGTGKTALAHHFARMVDRPLMVKRASDLLSKWVGETEANIADAFEEARACEAVLLFDEVDSLLFDRATARTSWEVGQVNELLTWLDRHPFPVIAATNNDGKLDPATKRRFLYKLQLKPLGREGTARAFVRFFGQEAPASLGHVDHLTPGDFAVVARQLRHEPGVDREGIVRRLMEEVAHKGITPGKIGF